MAVINSPLTHEQKSVLITQIKSGAIVIYPTDTIYGIGCDATNTESVRRIRLLKQRESKPFSVIAPSVNWIKEHVVESTVVDEALSRLPGPYTLLCKVPSSPVCDEVSFDDTLGIRIPDHWISELVAFAGVPFVTTSVNVSGEPFARSLEDIDQTILDGVDVVIDSGALSGSPSTLLDCRGDTLIEKKRN